MSLHILVVSSETPAQQAERRSYAGQSSHESYADALRRLHPEITLHTTSSIIDSEQPTLAEMLRYHGVVFAGSPIQMHKHTAEVRSAARFMTQVFQAGIPSFGSCAGLQIAAVAAGGKTGPRKPGAEVGFARDITRTGKGIDHALLRGKPETWTGPAMHDSIITQLPADASVLAANPDTPVEAAEIRFGQGIFWGVQYHPELSLREIAASLRHQADDIVGQGLAQCEEHVDFVSEGLRALDADEARVDLAWRFGLNEQMTKFDLRTVEIANFLDAVRR